MEPVFGTALREPGYFDGVQSDFLHIVKSGESLTSIANRYYQPMGQSVLMGIVGQIVRDNPQIKNPNLIYPGQLIRLRSPFRLVNTDPEDIEDIFEANASWRGLSEEEKHIVSHHEWLLNLIGRGAALGHGGGHGLEKALHNGKHVVGEIVNKYASYKRGEITKGAYDYYRKTQLAAYQKKTGSLFNRWVFEESKANRIFRVTQAEARSVASNIASRGAIGEFKPFSRQLGKLAKISKFSRSIAIVGTIVDLGAAGANVYEAWGTANRDDVICEEVGGAAASIVTGIVLTAALLSTGVGAVGIALIVGFGSVGGQMAGHWFGKVACDAVGITGQKARVIAPLHSERIK